MKESWYKGALSGSFLRPKKAALVVSSHCSVPMHKVTREYAMPTKKTSSKAAKSST